jgi:hypothetical protein
MNNEEDLLDKGGAIELNNHATAPIKQQDIE